MASQNYKSAYDKQELYDVAPSSPSDEIPTKILLPLKEPMTKADTVASASQQTASDVHKIYNGVIPSDSKIIIDNKALDQKHIMAYCNSNGHQLYNSNSTLGFMKFHPHHSSLMK